MQTPPYPDEPIRQAPRSRSLLAEGMVLLGMILLGLFGSLLVIRLLAVFAFDGSMAELQTAVANPLSAGDKGRSVVLGLQGITTLCIFALPPVLLVWLYRRDSLKSFSPRSILDNTELLWAILLVPALAPLLELTITWNKNLSLPGAFADLERWAQDTEAAAAKLTTYLLSFSSFGQFLFGLVIVAVLPAIGEELLFRGTIQPMIQRATGRPHQAIWLTAILFSAIHVQFYGFVPRMLLGALFGYLYYWSGNITIPMLAHFTNNGVTVALSYWFKEQLPSENPDTVFQAPWYVFILSTLAGAAVLYRFRERYFVRATSTPMLQ